MVKGPEIKLQSVVSDFPIPLPGQRFRGGKERNALLARMPMNEVEDSVRARAGTVDEAGPGHGALRGHAGAQPAVASAGTESAEIGEQAGIHQAF